MNPKQDLCQLERLRCTVFGNAKEELGETKENEASVLKTCLRLGLTETSDVPLVDGNKKTMSMSLFWVTGM